MDDPDIPIDVPLQPPADERTESEHAVMGCRGIISR
jgi:hypothetical protein